jgi:hypothetical protein
MTSRENEDMIPVVFECGTRLARVANVPKIRLVCGAIILALPLSSWLKGIKFLD